MADLQRTWEPRRMDGVVLARAHGAMNLVGGVWPLLHTGSFEAVFGPKTDRWLVKTVAGLLTVRPGSAGHNTNGRRHAAGPPPRRWHRRPARGHRPCLRTGWTDLQDVSA